MAGDASSPTALGFRAHTGWAAVVGLTGPAAAPVVVCRHRLVLVPDGVPADLYHIARRHDSAAAAELVRAGTEAVTAAAAGRLCEVLAEQTAAGRQVVTCSVLVGTARLPASLEAILASHALLHTAEGVLFREALLDAGQASGLRVAAIPEREVWHLAAAALGLEPDVLAERVLELGRAMGPPWGQDQKTAAVAAWMALATR